MLTILSDIKACICGCSICCFDFQQPGLISRLFAYLLASRTLKPGCAPGYAAHAETSQSSERRNRHRVPCPVFQHMVGAIQAGDGEHNAKPLGDTAYGSCPINARGVLPLWRTAFLFPSSSTTINWLRPSMLLSVIWFFSQARAGKEGDGGHLQLPMDSTRDTGTAWGWVSSPASRKGHLRGSIDPHSQGGR